MDPVDLLSQVKSNWGQERMDFRLQFGGSMRKVTKVNKVLPSIWVGDKEVDFGQGM